MFGSPCSIRSAQCATLIALAAAAGISRFEPPVPEQARSLRREPRVSAAHIDLLRHYLISIRAVAHQMSTTPTATRLTFNDGSAVSLTMVAVPTSPPIETPPVINFPPVVVRHPLRQAHAFPYAVGPPRHGESSYVRASCTEVHGDSRAAQIGLNRALIFSFLVRLRGAGVESHSAVTRSPEFRPARRTGAILFFVSLHSGRAPAAATASPYRSRPDFPV
jgi:hypothetical protein